jgi:hypothetical protein
MITITDAKGKVIFNRIISGTQVRDINGSVLLIRKDDRGEPATGMFTEASTGKIYKLSFPDKHYMVESTVPVPLVHRLKTRNDTLLGIDIVNGISCERYPLRSGSRDGQIVGSDWIDRPDEIRVRYDATTPAAKGGTVHEGMELTDIHINEAPSVGLIQLPAGFEQSAEVNCPRCGAGSSKK